MQVLSRPKLTIRKCHRGSCILAVPAKGAADAIGLSLSSTHLLDSSLLLREEYQGTYYAESRDIPSAKRAAPQKSSRQQSPAGDDENNCYLYLQSMSLTLFSEEALKSLKQTNQLVSKYMSLSQDEAALGRTKRTTILEFYL